ncbi:hypothetical protein BV25DRAFT_1824272 [Artomyces pyxidatus]|uniref:Uncharacterized protein n=1 Tax=Artomyces pyxidatus TaxID=48021 RepID=A0ACB8T613_9AGAM|nr:hypothetical protein BV25DRAFT_1824272 [Artomyces pyxidatus]
MSVGSAIQGADRCAHCGPDRPVRPVPSSTVAPEIEVDSEAVHPRPAGFWVKHRSR